MKFLTSFIILIFYCLILMLIHFLVEDIALAISENYVENHLPGKVRLLASWGRLPGVYSILIACAFVYIVPIILIMIASRTQARWHYINEALMSWVFLLIGLHLYMLTCLIKLDSGYHLGLFRYSSPGMLIIIGLINFILISMLLYHNKRHQKAL
jgi:hypothetical protein